MEASKDLILSMREQGFIYCTYHNIFFRKELEDDAQKKYLELKEKGSLGLALLVRACPLCKSDIINPLLASKINHRIDRVCISGRTREDLFVEAGKR